MPDVDNRVALVTGGAGGIGAACAARLARDGFDIVVADVKPASGVEKLIREAGRRCEYVCSDITDPGKVEALRAHVDAVFGRCDVLLNNAGFYSMVPLDTLSYETWRRYMSVNLDAAFLMSKAFAPLMRRLHHGRIISMASNSFYSNVPGMIAYMATKGGLIGMTRGLASELGGEGIRLLLADRGDSSRQTQGVAHRCRRRGVIPGERSVRLHFGSNHRRRRRLRTPVSARYLANLALGHAADVHRPLFFGDQTLQNAARRNRSAVGAQQDGF